MKTITKLLSFLLAAGFALAQTTTTSTTLSTAISSRVATVIVVASATGINAPSPFSTTQPLGSILYIDREEMCVTNVNSTTITVIRACNGTTASNHVSGATVWVGTTNGGMFIQRVGDPVGADGTTVIGGASCTASKLPYLPIIEESSGLIWDCPSTGLASGIFVVRTENQPTQYPDKVMYVPCQGAPSGNSTGTNGFSTVGTNPVGVFNQQTSASGTNTHIYICTVSPDRLPTASGAGSTLKGIEVNKVQFFYGVQSNALGTQAITGSSGTFNSVQVFNLITFPVAGASETASSNTLTRADSGTMTVTPAVGSFNTATTTAGTFDTETFTPATPFTYNTDLSMLQIDIVLQCAATTATITNSPGIWVYYKETM